MSDATARTATAEPKLTLARWAALVAPSSFQDETLHSTQPGMISFGLGDPDPALFPAQLLGRLAAELLESDRYALQYGPQPQALKAGIVEAMAGRGVRCSERQIILTGGAQQGLSLLARVLLDQGGQALTEALLYPDLQPLLATYQPDLLTVGSDLETGMEVDQVEARLRAGARPAFIYAVADGHNPLGVSMSADKRARLAGLARRYGVPVIEDDVYGFLQYEPEYPPPLRALDDEWVFYVGSFSKILAPALRVGWIVAPEALVAKLTIAKQAADLDVATFSQRVVGRYLQAGQLAAHLALIRDEYRLRRDVMLRALARHFPAGARWVRPTSGVFIWVELPPQFDTAALLPRAIKEAGVIFIPGQLFCVADAPAARRSLRLNFSNCPPERIEQGIARLGDLLRQAA